ncbi:hypothetical protein SacmaDRAFT_3094 [Saccharomonospora marina XMU15]|uniref:Uncharacterized protein n=1 Tax=Saccharomonospora marina XMU15 TaxID=882083 RepID=H5X7N7_9PSEU|nr:hypothetical protein [Saccharomonospora marina]EHR51329.1 hypothetical protein SacmaDRAFT_3094 [Saccharomonospora marina XMU15]
MTFPYDQARLAELVAEVDARLTGVDQAVSQANQLQTRSSGLSEQDLAAIERHAESPRAPRELKELVARIKEGELSWDDVASGRALDDEGVKAAMAASLPDLARAHQEIREGHDPDEIIGADTGDEEEGGGSVMRSGW